jgi:hypothetical protein
VTQQDSLPRQQAAGRQIEASESRTPARMTARGAALAMLVVFFVATAAADWLHSGFLTGFGLVAGCLLAARFARQGALLAVVVMPPLVFAVAVVFAELATASSSGHSGLLSAAEGVLLTLAAAAPWLFLGEALCLIVAFFRGLLTTIRELRDSLRG